MRLVEKDGLKYWQFELLLDCPEIVHGSYTRRGGVSLGEFSSLNVSYEVGDDPKSVFINREKIRESLNLPCLVDAFQCHSNQFFHLTHPSQKIPECDALITQLSGVGLLVKHADCQACLFYDPMHKVIANVHAGWKGNIKKVYTQTLNYMHTQFGCRKENILACLSPSLGPLDAEFIHYEKEFPTTFWPYQTRPYFFDLWEISKDELISWGLLEHHIEIAKISTLSNPSEYFSYRFATHTGKQKSGRLGSVIALK